MCRLSTNYYPFVRGGNGRRKMTKPIKYHICIYGIHLITIYYSSTMRRDARMMMCGGAFCARPPQNMGWNVWRITPGPEYNLSRALLYLRCVVYLWLGSRGTRCVLSCENIKTGPRAEWDKNNNNPSSSSKKKIKTTTTTTTAIANAATCKSAFVLRVECSATPSTHTQTDTERHRSIYNAIWLWVCIGGTQDLRRQLLGSIQRRRDVAY